MPETLQNEKDLFLKNLEKEEYEKEQLKKYETGLKELLEEYKKAKRSGSEFEWIETMNFDISNPHKDDMEKLWSGKFEISNFNVLEKKDEGITGFNFYIGDTEFIIRGKAVDKYYELSENRENNN